MILSVSRRTDIPAFYSEWFFDRLNKGFVYVRNPIYKKMISKISLQEENVDCFVFWSKNPKPFIKRIPELHRIPFYFQYTINAYDTDIEPFVPNKNASIETFIELSKTIGKEKVIWRYDPILLSDRYTIKYHLKEFESVANRVAPYTDKCVISFLDRYQKNEKKLTITGVRELRSNEIMLIAKQLKAIADLYNLQLETCAEGIELESIGIGHNRCIDRVLIEKILGRKINARKDKNQRAVCGCIESVDIGAYNTCRHGCIYCYANNDSKKGNDSFSIDVSNSPLLCGFVSETDSIVERPPKSIIDKTLFD